MLKSIKNEIIFYLYPLINLSMKNILLALFFGLIFIACETIFVENISDKQIEVLAPKSNATLSKGVVHFLWNPLNDVDNYRLKVATPNFKEASQIILDTTLTKTSFHKNLTKGSYEWQIIGVNSAYQTRKTNIVFKVN